MYLLKKEADSESLTHFAVLLLQWANVYRDVSQGIRTKLVSICE